MKNKLYVASGLFFLFLAIWGAIIPMLPFTPFLALGSSLLLKGDERLHKKVMGNPKMNQIISDWNNHKVVGWDIKIAMMTIFTISMSFSIWVAPMREAKLVLAAFLVILYITILLIPSKIKEQA